MWLLEEVKEISFFDKLNNKLQQRALTIGSICSSKCYEYSISIRENITFGNSQISDEKIKKVLTKQI